MKDKRHFLLLIDNEMHQQIREAAARRRMSMSDWIRQAILAYERKADQFEQKRAATSSKWASGWSKSKACPAAKCERVHDPAEHNPASMNAIYVKDAYAAEGLPDPYAN